MSNVTAHPRQNGRPKPTLKALNAFNSSIPFNSWLRPEVLSVEEDTVRLRVPWRVEFGGAPGTTHGGILAAIIDLTAYMVLMIKQGAAGPTIDMRVDFHRSTASGTFFAVGKLLRAGATISTVEVHIHNSAERLLASGRCVFLSQPRGRLPDVPSSE